MSTIIATFKNMQQADMAINNLLENGILRDEIGVAKLDNDQNTIKSNNNLASSITEGITDVAGKTVSGAVGGGVLGGVIGLLAGVAAISIPGLGGLLVAGPIAAALGLSGVAATAATGAGAGSAIGGVVGIADYLVKAGITQADAQEIQETLQNGGILVSIADIDEITGSQQKILHILQSHEPSKLLII